MGGLIYVFESNLQLENCLAENFTNGGITAETSEITVRNSSFGHSVSYSSQSVILCEN